jgi:hypothetical protein
MSSLQKSQTNPPLKQQTHLLIGSAIVVFCIISIGVISFLAGKQEGKKQAGQNSIINYSGQRQPIILGDQVNNWNGTIVSVNDNTLIVSVPGTGAGAKPQQIAVTITPTTQLMKWDLTKTQPAGTGSDTSKEFISRNQLTSGKRVLVQANSDVNSKQEVAATNISLIITPSS